VQIGVKEKPINFREEENNQNLTIEKLIKSIKEKINEKLSKNNLQITDLNPEL
jgi:hypothetical protein